MKNVRRIIGFFLGMLCSIFLYGQGVDSLHRRMQKFSEILPQEKVYLHIDNTCYFVGDTIWYKGYVTRADNGKATDMSKILYVELLTPDGYLVERQQLEMPDGTTHGAFVLTDSLYAGYYELRAYTRWMLNFGVCERPHSAWIKDAFYNDRMEERFFRDYEKLYSRVFPVYDKPEEAGKYVKDMTLRPMRRYFRTRTGKPKLDLKFYPEGGSLVTGASQCVAFELNTEEGEHLEDVEIVIRNKREDCMVKTKSGKRGRGRFVLPDVSETGGYHAVFAYRGYDYEVELPQPEPGVSMTVTEEDSVLSICLQRSCTTEGIADGMALQVMGQGVPRSLHHVDFGGACEITFRIPKGTCAGGVNQLTLFDGAGRIYGERQFFIRPEWMGQDRLSVDGLQNEYQSYDSITLFLRLVEGADTTARVSLSVRDRATEESLYDNGTVLTEMLLGSELKGFVENPGYYFECDDSVHRHDLDLLMMVQGWRRYKWREMAGVEPFCLSFLPERVQTLFGSANHTYTFYRDNEPGELAFIDALMINYDRDTPIDFYTTETCAWLYKGKSQRHLYRSMIYDLKKEVSVMASFSQGGETMNLFQRTQKGFFEIPTPKLYGPYELAILGSDEKEEEKVYNERFSKGYSDETDAPNYYMKRDLFYPVFPQPYGFYQDALGEQETFPDVLSTDSLSLGIHRIPEVTVRSKKSGLRRLDTGKPAVVWDAYEVHNYIADYGLNGGRHDWRTFSQAVAVASVADMGTERRPFIQECYDGRAINLKSRRTTDFHKPLGIAGADTTNLFGKLEYRDVAKASDLSMSTTTIKRYRKLRYLDKIYVYTDYAPREYGSWKYKQDNQPDVIVDYRMIPDDGYRRSFRDRRYVLHGYAVCEDFYSPDYSRKPLPEHCDNRRTLLWIPQVKFDSQGEARIRLYNNGKTTSLSIEAEGIDGRGYPIVWKTE